MESPKAQLVELFHGAMTKVQLVQLPARRCSLYAGYCIQDTGYWILDTIWGSENPNENEMYTVYVRKHTNFLFVKRRIWM